jgi:hypothetical protein
MLLFIKTCIFHGLMDNIDIGDLGLYYRPSRPWVGRSIIDKTPTLEIEVLKKMAIPSMRICARSNIQDIGGSSPVLDRSWRGLEDFP